MNLKSRVLSGLKWSAGAKLFGQIVSWASTIIVIRQLEPDDYGLMAIALVFSELCYLLGQLGLGAAIVHTRDLNARLLRQVFTVNIISNVFVFAALFLSAPAISDWFDKELLVDILRVQAFQFLLLIFYIVPYAKLTRDMDYKTMGIIEMLGQFANAVTALSLALSGFGVWSLVIGSMTDFVLRTILFNIVRYEFLLPTLNFKGFGKMADYAGFTTLDNLLWYFYNNVDRFIIGKLLNASVLGVYSVAMQLASLPLEKLGAIMHQIALPAYSSIQEDKPKISSYTKKVIAATNLMTVPIFFGISATAPIFVPLLLGDKWLDAVLPIQIISMLGPMRVLNSIMQPAIAGLGLPRVNAGNLAIACVIIPVGLVIGAQWGLIGAVLAWAVAFSIWYVLMLLRVLPVFNVTMAEFFDAFYAPLIAGVLMYVAVIGTALIIGNINPWLLLGLQIAAGGVVYMGFIYLFQRAKVDLLRSMLLDR